MSIWSIIALTAFIAIGFTTFFFREKAKQWLKRARAFFGAFFEEDSGQKDPFETETGFVAGVMLLVTLLAVVLVSWFVNPPWAFIWFGVTVAYVGTCLHAVRDPDVAYLFRFGRMVGRLTPGWYLVLPHLWDVVVVDLEVKKKVYEAAQIKIPLKGKMFVSAKVILSYKIGNTKSALKKALALREEDEDLLEEIALAYLFSKIGEYDYDGLISHQDDIEQEVLEALVKEFKKYGYKMIDIHIRDIDETTLTEAEKIKEIGKARGVAARELAEPFRNNPWAMGASLGGEFIDYLKKSRTGKKKKLDVEAAKEGGEKLAKAAESVKGFVEKFVGGEK